jgi:nucleotide-binding universal stress UspA family protein
MPGRILVALDGSELAERALGYAVALARPTGSRLLLVRAVLGRPIPGVGTDAGAEAAVREAEEYLEGVASRLAGEGIECEIAVPSHGLSPLGDEPARLILEEARRKDADLIAMMTHGRSGLGRWLYGSVAEGVLAQTPVPVLLVRGWQGVREPATFGERPQLLVPLDGSGYAEQALPVATSLAEGLSGELVLVRAVPRPDLPFAPDRLLASQLEEELRAGEAEARRYLDALADRLAREGRRVRVEMRVGEPTPVISEVGRELGATLVVMTTLGETGLVRLVFGSVAAGVLRQGSVPLLLVRPRTP